VIFKIDFLFYRPVVGPSGISQINLPMRTELITWLGFRDKSLNAWLLFLSRFLYQKTTIQILRKPFLPPLWQHV